MEEYDYCIVGMGAIGGLFAHFLSHRRVLGITRRRSHAEALRGGLVVETPGGERVLRIPVKWWGEGVEEGCRTVIVAVKSYDAAEAVRQAARLEPRLMVVAQNGFGGLEEAERLLGSGRAAAAVITYGVTRISDSRIRVAGIGEILLGHRGKPHPLTRLLVEDLVKGGCSARLVGDVEPYRWLKAIANAAINPVSAILGVHNGFLIESPEAQRLLDLVVGEAARVAEALGVALPEDPLAYTLDVVRKTYSNYSSMLQDLERRGRTEINEITGYIVEAGRRLGVPTPINEALLLLVRGAERWRRLRRGSS